MTETFHTRNSNREEAERHPHTTLNNAVRGLLLKYGLRNTINDIETALYDLKNNKELVDLTDEEKARLAP